MSGQGFVRGRGWGRDWDWGRDDSCCSGVALRTETGGMFATVGETAASVTRQESH